MGLSKIAGGRAEVIYKMLARAEEKEAVEEGIAEKEEEKVEEEQITGLEEEKSELGKWIIIIANDTNFYTINRSFAYYEKTKLYNNLCL